MRSPLPTAEAPAYEAEGARHGSIATIPGKDKMKEETDKKETKIKENGEEKEKKKEKKETRRRRLTSISGVEV